MTDLSRILSRFSLPAAALSFAAGICHGRFGPAPTAPLTWFFSLFVLALLLRHLASRQRRFIETISLLLLFYLAGIIHLDSQCGSAIQSPLETQMDSGEPVILSGHLAAAPAYTEDGAKIILLADQWWRPTGEIIPLDEQILLAASFPIPPHLEPGNRLLARATLRRPQPPGTPGAFDYRQFLADRDIHITGFLRSPACLAPLYLTTPPEDNRLHSLRYWPQRLRQKINLFLAASPLTPQNIGLYQALLTGELGLVPAQLLADFRATGAFHLLSISGTHLGLLGLLCGLGLNLLLRRSRRLLLDFTLGKLTAALTILILLLYALLAGMNPPVVRALIMALCLIDALLVNRPHSLINSLGLALLLSLLWRPTDLFYASFQLSYAAIGGIVALHTLAPTLLTRPAPPQPPSARLAYWLQATLAVSLAALLATAPLTQYHFQQVALLGPVSTMLLAPLLCFWALPLGLLAAGLCGWLPGVATLLLQLGSLALSGGSWLNSTLAALPLSSWQHAPLPLAGIPLYYLFLAALLCSRKSLPARAIAGAALTLLLALIMFPTTNLASGQTRITFLDVGQGSSTLLELPGGRNILVDGGCVSRNGYDVGARVIVPFLRQRGVKALEALVISHDHADHFNGLAAVIKEFPPRQLWSNGGPERTPELTALLNQATRQGALLRIPAAGETLLASRDTELTCLGEEHLQPAPRPENHRSLVLRFSSGGKTFLLPGDIMTEEGEKLLKAGSLGKCDVLLAPHHGSDNSASLILAESGRPAWLVVSAGASESGKFPGAKLRQWCRQNGANLHQTGAAGALTFTVGPDGLSWRRLSSKAAAAALAEDE